MTETWKEGQQKGKVDLGRLQREAQALFIRALRQYISGVFEDLRTSVLPHFKPQMLPRREVGDWAVRWNLVYGNGGAPPWLLAQVESILGDWFQHPKLADELLFTYDGGDFIEVAVQPLVELPEGLEAVVADRGERRFQKLAYIGNSSKDGPPTVDARSNRLAQTALAELIKRARAALAKLKSLQGEQTLPHTDQKDWQHFRWFVECLVLEKRPKDYPETVRVAHANALDLMFELLPFKRPPVPKGRPKGIKEQRPRHRRA